MSSLRNDLFRAAVEGRAFAPLGNPIVKASWVRELAVLGEMPGLGTRVHPRGLRVRGVRIDGQLDFEHARLLVPVLLDYVQMGGLLVAENAVGIALGITNSEIGGVRANSLRLTGSLDLSGTQVSSVVDLDGVEVRRDIVLRNGFVAHSGARLGGVRIGNQLRCENGTFKSQGGPALFADSAQVGGGAYLSQGFSAIGEVRFGGASFGQLTCSGGRFENPQGLAISGDDMRSAGGVYLDDGFVALGEVRVSGAEVGGQLSCRAGTFQNPGGLALLGESMRVGDMAFLDEGFSAVGEVRLTNAFIGGKLGCIGGSFSNADGMALNCDSLSVSGSVDLARGFNARGEVRLSGAAIGGDLYCVAGDFANHGRRALAADGVRVSGSVILEEGFHADGAVELRGAAIGGQLGCMAGTFSNAATPSLVCDGAEIARGAFLGRGFTSHGEVRLVGASVPVLDCDGGQFSNPGRVALAGDKLQVSTKASFCDGFASSGEVRLAGAVIGGQLAFRGATLSNAGGRAVIANGARVDWDVLLDNGFASVGEVSIAGASIGGQLRCVDGSFTNQQQTGLTIHSTVVQGALVWNPRALAPDTTIDLRSASVGLLQDDVEKWPETGLLKLNGFTYAGIDRDTAAASRLRWIQRSVPYRPQPYEQLAHWNRTEGHGSDARHINIAKEKARHPTIPRWWRRWAHAAWGSVTSYGYQPARALLIFAGVLLLAWLFYSWAGGTGAMKPRHVAAGETARATECTSAYPCYQPFIYAADVMIPIVNLGQSDAWYADAAHVGLSDRILPWAQGETIRATTIALIFVGWILTAALIASIGQTISRE